MFVEVNSFDKGCPVIVNMDMIVEIAPLVDGGCILFMNDGAGMNSRQGIRVTDNYDQFKQFVLQTVTAEDIERRFLSKVDKMENQKKKVELDKPLEIPKL
jgi:hypothetical protein